MSLTKASIIFVFIKLYKQNIKHLCCALFIVVCSIAAFVPSAMANKIEHVNIGRVLVQDQSSNSQKEAGKLALKQVFTKLSGNLAIADNEPIARAIDNFEQYLESSSFIQIDDNLVFEASFNQEKIESLLIASQLNVWTSLRPSAVLWLAIERPGESATILSQNTSTSLIEVVAQQSFARGVQIIIPIGDLQDQMGISIFDVSNQFVSRLKESSLRYDTNMLISASLESFDAAQAIREQAIREQANINEARLNINQADTNEDSTQIQSASTFDGELLQEDDADLMLVTNKQKAQADDLVDVVSIPENAKFKIDYVITNATFSSTNEISTGTVYGLSEEEALTNLVDVYSDRLAKQYALKTVLSTTVSTIQIEVNKLSSLQDYVALTRLIKTIPSVDNVSLIKQQGTTATISIEHNLPTEQFISILSLDERVSNNSALSPSAAKTISFTWNQ